MAQAFRGAGQTNIQKPYGLTQDELGRLYVVDNHYQAVHVYDPEKNKYFRFPEKGRDDFKNPVGIVLGTGGRIFISDSVTGRVHVFSDLGDTYVGSIGAGQLQRPTGLAINHKTRELLVLDTLASQLMVYDERDLRFKRSVGGSDETDSGAPMFHYPTAITVADDGQVSARAQTPRALDLALAAQLRKDPGRYPGSTLDVRMTFDNSVIPQWMRQYSNHYFNRVVTNITIIVDGSSYSLNPGDTIIRIQIRPLINHTIDTKVKWRTAGNGHITPNSRGPVAKRSGKRMCLITVAVEIESGEIS